MGGGGGGGGRKNKTKREREREKTPPPQKTINSFVCESKESMKSSVAIMLHNNYALLRWRKSLASVKRRENRKGLGGGGGGARRRK